MNTSCSLEVARASVLRALWLMIACVFLPSYSFLFLLEWREVLQDPVRMLVYIGVPAGSILLWPGTGWKLATRGHVAVTLLGALTVPVLVKTGLRQPSAGVTSILTMALAVLFGSRAYAKRWISVLIIATAAGVLLRSAGLVDPSQLAPVTLANDLLRSMIIMVSSVVVATIPFKVVQIYEEANAAQRREYELRLEAEQRAREMQRQELVGTMAKGMTHDLANLLQTVSAGMELLRDSNDAAYRHRVADEVMKVTDRATETLRSLMAVGRPAASSNLSTIASADMHALCERLTSLVPSLVGSRIAVSMQCNTASRVALPLEQLEQVVLNLIFNARDAMLPEGGTLSIGAHDAAADSGGTSGKAGVRLTVTDSGAGIRPDLLPRIFEPYVSGKAPGNNTGLGLAIVSSTVTAAGGRIDVKSTPGKGTTFAVWLPAAG